MTREVFSDQPAMAMLGSFFAAQEASIVQQFLGDGGFDFALAHQVEELALVNVPIALLFFVSVQHFLGGS
jgi:hypothetical protein